MVKRFSINGKKVVEAIKEAEKCTNAEIRVAFRRKLGEDGVDEARKLFHKLKMFETAHRNGVLVLVETDKRRITVFGDEGIYAAAGHDAFAGIVKTIEKDFAERKFTEGLARGIAEIGEMLKKYYPYDAATDKNELSDRIDGS